MMGKDLTVQWQTLIDAVSGYGLELIAALVILVFGWWLAGRVQKLILRALDRLPRMDATLKPFLSSLARYAIIAITLVAVLARLGVQTTSIIAVLGAAGLAIGLALQGTLQNIAAGIMLLLLRPFKVGDYIDAGGISGTVDEIGLFTTDMTTFDGVYRSVPNASLWNTSILNYSRLPTRRMDVPVGIAYEDDVERAMALLLTNLGESSVDLSLRCWADRSNFWTLKFELNKNAKLWLDAAGISIPFPQRDVHLIPTSEAGGANPT